MSGDKNDDSFGISLQVLKHNRAIYIRENKSRLISRDLDHLYEPA